MSVRYLVSAYLFLSAFGHTCYFWRKNSQADVESQDDTNLDFKCITKIWPLVRRYLEVMYRMNLFAVVLCFMMNQKYMFYYFVPLISFWFTYLFVAMSLFFQILMRKSDVGGSDIDSAKLCRFVVKLVVFALLILAPIELLHRMPSVFSKIFFTAPLRGIFTIYETWDHKKSLQEPWLFRWSVDRYTLVFGMLFTVCLKWCQQCLGTNVLPNALANTPRPQATSHKHSTWNYVAAGITILGLTVTVAVAISVYGCRDKISAILLHPYVCIIPILAYMSMRNALLPVRTRYSAFFAWCGDISLELYLVQFHVWMSNNSYGILYLVPNFPLVNFALISATLLCVSHEVHYLTAKLQRYIVPDSPAELLFKGLLIWLLYLFLIVHI
ncbi:hypothetical protein CRM22_006481 [Opisthorchis felineus]|uniref:Cas1p 10 TM acyl transferase domain-containing protein n=1 Tax=Opisthorchis felineus TaxID=147828 RepID=A0A4S2LKW5_OPIFE|nr:hypothetical protein CRM22_006481 [Opisthorchis felineus]